jgi:hypothetical protein
MDASFTGRRLPGKAVVEIRESALLDVTILGFWGAAFEVTDSDRRG